MFIFYFVDKAEEPTGTGVTPLYIPIGAGAKHRPVSRGSHYAMTPSGATTEDGGYTEVALIDLETQVNVSVLLRQNKASVLLGIGFHFLMILRLPGKRSEPSPGEAFHRPPLAELGTVVRALHAVDLCHPYFFLSGVRRSRAWFATLTTKRS